MNWGRSYAKKAFKPCGSPYCTELTAERYCEKHRKKQYIEYDKWRGSASQRGYGQRWRKARLHFLRRNPLCVMYEGKGEVELAIVVDHVIPHSWGQEIVLGCWGHLAGALISARNTVT